VEAIFAKSVTTNLKMGGRGGAVEVGQCIGRWEGGVNTVRKLTFEKGGVNDSRNSYGGATLACYTNNI